MISVCNKQDLNSLLAKAVIGCRLRENLTRLGISADEFVKIEIKRDDKTLINQEIPKKSPRDAIERPVTDLVKEVEDFFNDAQAFNDFLGALTESESSTEESTETLYTFTYDIGSPQFGESLDHPHPLRIVLSRKICCCPTKHIC